jgi:large subunit ribosomal protein L21
MFAVIKTGGKQYRVAKDDIILVERLPGDAGAAVSLDEVLMVGEGQKQTVGAPLVSGASVAATILDQPRSDKIIVFKKNRRKNYRRRAGHRQNLSVLQITDIMADGKKAAKSAAAAEKPAVEKPTAKKPATVKPAAAKGKAAETKTAKKPAAKKAATAKVKATPARKATPAKSKE